METTPAEKESALDQVLHHALLSLLVTKPDDPISFLADYFHRECEPGNRVIQAAHLLSDINTQHAVLEQRLRSAYATISQFKVQGEVQGCTGDIYSDLLTYLLKGLPDVSTEKVLQKLRCQNSEYIPFPVFRSGVLTCLVLKEFVQEVKALYADFIPEGEDKAPRPLCDAALGYLSTALAETSSDPSLVLQVAEKMSVPSITKTFDESLTCDCAESGMDLTSEEFLIEAINSFTLQIQPVK